jgi:hypothetical protein
LKQIVGQVAGKRLEEVEKDFVDCVIRRVSIEEDWKEVAELALRFGIDIGLTNLKSAVKKGAKVYSLSQLTSAGRRERLLEGPAAREAEHPQVPIVPLLPQGSAPQAQGSRSVNHDMNTPSYNLAERIAQVQGVKLKKLMGQGFQSSSLIVKNIL